MKTIRLGNKVIGPDTGCYFIADIAANHDGSLDRAYRLIELAKESGADAAKFQNFTARTIVSKKGFESLNTRLSHQATWKRSVYEVYEDASLSRDWTERLKLKCNQVGIEYFTSPYDFDSVDHVDPHVNMYKVGSGDITWIEIIEYMASKGKPMLLATGASDFQDVRRAVDAIAKYTDEVVLMQCNTNYTVDRSNFHHINLNVLKLYAQEYPGVVLGLSDHTPGHTTVLGALALGARVFEKHFTDDNGREGPDHKFAMTPRTWREMVEAASDLQASMGDGIKRIEGNELETSCLQRRGLRYSRALSKGDVIKAEDLFPLRPIAPDGVPPYCVGNYVGKMIRRDVVEDEPLKSGDV